MPRAAAPRAFEAAQAAAEQLWAALDEAARAPLPLPRDADADADAAAAASLPSQPRLLEPLLALHALRQRMGDIPTPKAALLVASLGRLLAEGPADAAAAGWPAALELLARWAGSVDGGGAEEATAELIASGGTLVLRALRERACPATAVGAAAAFLGGAARHPAGPAPAECAAAVAAALTGLGPVAVTPRVLPGLLRGVGTLLEASVVGGSGGISGSSGSGGTGSPVWLLTALLQALASQLPEHLAAEAATAAAANSGGGDSSFLAQEALDAAAAAAAGRLCGLHALGRRVATAALMRPANAPGAAAAAAAALGELIDVLSAGCRERAGDLLAAGLCAAAGCGVADGVLASAARLTGAGAVAGAAVVAAAAPPGAPGAAGGLPPAHPLAARCERLLAGVARACARCSEAEAGGVTAGAAAPVAAAGAAASVQRAVATVATAVAGHGYCALMRAHGALLPAPPAPGGLLCALAATLDCGLSPAALHVRALRRGGGGGSSGDSIAAANQEDGGVTGAGPLEHDAGAAARWVAAHCARAPLASRLALSRRLLAAAARTAGRHDAFVAAAAAAAPGDGGGSAQAGIAAALRNVLDRTFAVHIVVMGALWASVSAAAAPASQPAAAVLGSTPAAPTAADAAARAALAAQLLAALSRLQFCRLALPQYGDLVTALASEAAGSAAAAEQLLAYCRAARGELLLPGASGGGNGGSAAAPAAAAALSFLLPLLPLALRRARDPGGAAADAVVPLALAAAAHPEAGVALAGHSAVAAILAQQTATDGAADNGAPTLAERVAPAYVKVAAGALPAAGSFEGLRLGLHFLLRALPPGSGAALFAVARLCDRAAELAAEAAALGYYGVDGGGSGSGSGRGSGTSSSGIAAGTPSTTAADAARGAAAADAAAKLFALVVQALAAVDFSQLPAALALASAPLRAAPPGARRAWLADAQAAVLASADAARKQRLVDWLLAAAADGSGGSSSSSASSSARRWPRSKL